MARTISFLTVLFLSCLAHGARMGLYHVLPTTSDSPLPFHQVRVIQGPDDDAGIWWEIQPGPADSPLVRVRGLTDKNPFSTAGRDFQFLRYLVHVPSASEAFEYRNRYTGKALLPPWKDFAKHFVPSPAKGTVVAGGFPNTASFLGHVLTLDRVGSGDPWEDWNPVVLDLDPELLVGSGRSVKDSNGKRVDLEKEEDYRYIPFTREDYTVMIEAGFNMFTVGPEQERIVRGQPVFYSRAGGRNRPLDYPADLYRSNYIGPVMYMDEPTMRLIGDKAIHNTLRYFSDFSAVIRRKVSAKYNSPGGYGAYLLERQLVEQGVNLGAMPIMQVDYPSWETALETTFYQMEGGCNGLVHEGRYQLAEFQDGMDRWTGVEREYTAEEYLRYQYALLRGGTRPFGKYWGMSIYGQADPAISPLAVKMAYDLGARYIWFWTSDKDHHLPWNEQVELARALREHAKAHPRPSIFDPLPVRDKVIAIPYGYFLSLSHLGENVHANLWWVRELDPEGKNESSQRYRGLMERAHKAVIEALEAGEDFDITVDDGREIEGYREVVRIPITDGPGE